MKITKKMSKMVETRGQENKTHTDVDFFQFPTDEIECLDYPLCVSGDCDDPLWGAPVTDVDSRPTLRWTNQRN